MNSPKYDEIVEELKVTNPQGTDAAVLSADNGGTPCAFPHCRVYSLVSVLHPR